ncbi:MAG: type II toxin-antitoxin system PemK/MazF family toxin [Ruminococcus sp.]|nr:type II toxin-antitoxin system PemK/MazF family toxin [Ruminococcus sp.]
MKHTFEKSTLVHRGDIFYVDLGKSDGTSTQAGIRPVVICSNKACNIHSPIVTVCSISTSKTKHRIPTHIPLLASETGLSRDSICLCEQPLSISKSDLLEYVTTLSEEHMERISDGLRIQLAL